MAGLSPKRVPFWLKPFATGFKKLKKKGERLSYVCICQILDLYSVTIWPITGKRTGGLGGIYFTLWITANNVVKYFLNRHFLQTDQPVDCVPSSFWCNSLACMMHLESGFASIPATYATLARISYHRLAPVRIPWLIDCLYYKARCISQHQLYSPISFLVVAACILDMILPMATWPLNTLLLFRNIF